MVGEKDITVVGEYYSDLMDKNIQWNVRVANDYSSVE